MKYYVKSYENLINHMYLYIYINRLPDLSKHFDKRIEQTLTILDVKGMKFKSMNKEVYNFVKIGA